MFYLPPDHHKGTKVGEVTFQAAAGKVRHRLKGKLSPSKLSPGRYRVQLRVTNAAGLRASAKATYRIS